MNHLLCTQLLPSPRWCVCGTLRKHCDPKVPRSCVPVILRIMTECETSGVDFAVIAGTQSLRSPYKALCRGLGLALRVPSTPRCFQSSSSNPEDLQHSFPTTSLKTPISAGETVFPSYKLKAYNIYNILCVYIYIIKCNAQVEFVQSVH